MLHGMILAAGLGTRLRPLSDELPKPAVPVLNRPLAAFALDHLARSGVRTIGLNTHHLASRLRATVEPHVPAFVRSLFTVEDEILGTGGGIRATWRALGEPDPFIVMNGDVLFEPDLAGALELHATSGASATMVLRTSPKVDSYGSVEIDDAGRVRRLLGHPAGEGELRKFMFTGVHILTARAIHSLPERGCVVRQGYRLWLDRGDVIAGFVDESRWLDLGTVADYAQAQLDLLEDGWPLPGGLTTTAEGLLDPSANIQQGARLQHCIVGAGARIAGGVELTRVIAWPGAVIEHDLADSIVTTEGQHVTWR